MKPNEAKEIKDLLIQANKKVDEYRNDLGKASEVMTSMVGEEVAHITKNQVLHQEKDNEMFGVLTEMVHEIKESGERREEKLNKVYMVICGDKDFGTEPINKRVGKLEKLSQRLTGVVVILGVLLSSGIVAELIHHFSK